jgi:F0F1-type ATP synthase membrane subunit b/b'
VGDALFFRLLEQSTLVVGLGLLMVFLWRYALPKMQEFLDRRDAAVAERDRVIAEQQAKHEATLQRQVEEGRQRGEARDRDFLTTLKEVTTSHAVALAANTEVLQGHASEVARLSNQVAALADRVKPPPRKRSPRLKAT